MRIVSQNVLNSRLMIGNHLYCSIDKGLVLLIGFTQGDDESVIAKMADKVLKMRVFQDIDGKTNLSVIDVQGSILAIPQFTLYADSSDGRRPSFTKALAPAKASVLFDIFIATLKAVYPDVSQGVFGADMEVNLTNDGPFTLILDSKDLIK
ncbi:MAG: D-aminoacyl-tRNA deacylase [Bacilli bacterium]|jgi:D-tyrosyl-tRNA(Tyr) deacylase|nr:D-aminoacyl-tRNA deacylase [Bacilli bacterium]